MRSGDYPHITHQLTVTVVVKPILDTIEKYTGFHHSSDIVCSDSQTTFWKTEFLKGDKKEFRWIITSEDAITRKLRDFQSERIRSELDGLAIDVLFISPSW
jgi:hypothetical protein